MQYDMKTQEVATAPDMVFEVSTAGPAGAPLVLFLHGFSSSRFAWNAPVEALGNAGYFAAAPNQRGYSPKARPDPADFDGYKMDKLIQDVPDLVTALGYGDQRFHLVGHDWGGSLAWEVADRYPERLLSLSILSRPHPLAFNRALELDEAQKSRSSHHTRFLDPAAGPNILADDVKWLRDRLKKNGVPADAIERHVSVMGSPAAMEAALAWYRARGAYHPPVGPTRVPTLYIWGDADDSVGRVAAEGTGEFVSAPFRFEVLPGGGHFTANQFPGQVAALLLDHVARHSA
jgi:pimeloyl-ACP methyl ester carboxylesterase